MKKEHLGDFPAAFAHAGPLRVGRGIAESSLFVAQHDFAFEIRDFLTDALVLVIFIAQGDDHRAVNVFHVIEPEADLEFKRNQVGQVYQWVDIRKITFVAKPAPEGFGRRTMPGRVDVKGFEKSAGTDESGRQGLEVEERMAATWWLMNSPKGSAWQPATP